MFPIMVLKYIPKVLILIKENVIISIIDFYSIYEKAVKLIWHSATINFGNF